MKNEIPAKFPYELRENANFYNNWTNDSILVKAIISDVIRIFDRKEITLKSDENQAFTEYIISKVKNSETMRESADELILSQRLSSGMKQAKYNNNGGDNLEV